MKKPLVPGCFAMLMSLAVVSTAAAQTTVPAPTSWPPPGSYQSRLQVSLFDSAGATGGEMPAITVIYTTDGSTPTSGTSAGQTHGTTYMGAITVNASETIKAIAVNSTGQVSSVYSAPYSITLPQESPLPAGEWAWEGPANPNYVQCGGPGSGGNLGIYGSKGVPAATNTPGSRDYAMNWTDANGNLWLFGGYGYGDALWTCGLSQNDMWMYNPSTKEWTWMGGNIDPMQFSSPLGTGDAGVYGTKGQFATANNPGSRQQGVTWTDHSGNLWLFGGYGFDSAGTLGDLNDVWEYKPSTHQWAWIAGSKLVNQRAYFNSFGVFHSGNTPGARQGAVSWTDNSGNFWLFGGSGYDAVSTQGELCDLWEFIPSTGLWAWMGGSHYANQWGTYNTLGVPSQGGHPGGRHAQMGWVDSNGHLWLFGGLGYSSWGGIVALNDLWEFNPNTLQWTWRSGYFGPGTYVRITTGYQVFNTPGQPGVYGDLTVPEPGNTPGGRASGSTWTDRDGNLWLFGGKGYDSAGTGGPLNDLWEFKPSTGLWSWMGGANTVNGVGNQGQLGVPSATNVPYARAGASSWTDQSGDFWLFGADVWGQTGNDLWMYQAP